MNRCARWAQACLVLAAGGLAHAQHAPPPAGPAVPARTEPQPAHRPHPQLPPAAALEHLRAGHRRVLEQHRGADREATAPPPRPAGAGRWVAAVVVCADADLDVAGLFQLERRDVLVLATPAAGLTAESVALLEHAVAEERLSLCVVLTHADCLALREPAAGTPASPARLALQRSLAAARTRARERGVPLAQAQAETQCLDLLAASAPLQAAAEAGAFRAVAATVDPRSLALSWHTRAAEELPLAPVK